MSDTGTRCKQFRSITYLSTFVCVRVVAQACTALRRVCPILWRHLRPLWLHHVFRHYLISGAISEGGKRRS
jgi:hypothetical protein